MDKPLKELVDILQKLADVEFTLKTNQNVLVITIKNIEPGAMWEIVRVKCQPD